MITCPSCGSEAAEGFKFCPECGARFAAPAAHPEERKVVTTLFCDLVGSTELGEDADPEDVDALLRRYNALARQAVEGYGGVVEKFIGDAVVAVFGVPAAHEDDAERAVRAGLRIVRAVEDLPALAGHPIQVRIGVNTGEALVRLDVTPGSGEGFLTGDATNAGARLQAAAPPMSVVVGVITHQLTEKTIVYEALAPVVAKGKREPLEAWLALEPVARTGARAPEGATPLVGRSVELSYLTALLDKAADSSSPQIALVVGEPGIGKSRVVAELFARVDAETRLVTWRQGRCLPYGEGVTLWALAEIVKGHAGILESDDTETVEAKLEAVLPEGEDRPWFRQRLRALLGLEAAKAEREENFTAWVRFLEDLAAEQPAILVFEDLHWADEALLDFLQFFALHVSRVPLMVVGTARPELFERHPAFAAAVRINRIALEPLSRDETEELIGSVLDELAVDVRASIAQQAQGNPFYAEESARLVRDDAGGRAKVTLAGSVQAVIAARLDALSPEAKTVLADAAVAGDVFWDGLLAVMGGRSAEELAPSLSELVAKQLIYHSRTSSMAGEREYAFGHVLAREVAYNQLPRLARARKHAAVASWTEAIAADRQDELCEVVAHHRVTAFDLAAAAGDTDMQEGLRDQVVTSLARAGGQLAKLDNVEAERLFLRAHELAPLDHPALPKLLFGLGDARLQAGQFASAISYLQDAVTASDALGDVEHAVRARVQLNSALVYTEGAPHLDLIDDALRLAEQHPPSRTLVDAITTWAFWQTQGTPEGRPEVTIKGYKRAANLMEQLGLPPDPGLIMVTAITRCALGDAGALEQAREAVRLAAKQGLGPVQAHVLADYSTAVVWLEGPAAGLEPVYEAIDFAERRGLEWDARFLRAGVLEQYFLLGRWQDVLKQLPRIVAEVTEAGDVVDAIQLHELHVQVLTLMGMEPELRTAVSQLERPECLLWWAIPYFDVPMAGAVLLLGDAAAAREHLRDWCDAPTRVMSAEFAWLIPQGVRVALEAGDEELAGRVAQRCKPLAPFERLVAVTTDSLLNEAKGEHGVAAAGFADAAARWHEFEVPYEEAQALLGQGRCLVALGRAPEAAPVLEQAREIFARLGGRPALEKSEQLLAKSGGMVQ